MHTTVLIGKLSNYLGTTNGQPEIDQTEEKGGAILAPIQIIVPIDDSEEEEEAEIYKLQLSPGTKIGIVSDFF